MKNKINLMFMVGAIGVLISAGLYFYLYLELLNNMTEALSLHDKLIEHEKTLSDLDKIEQNLNTTLIKSDKLSTLFVKPDIVVDFIQEVETIFKESGVSGEVTSVSEETFTLSDNNEQKRLLIVLSAGGDWNSLLKLVGLLERLPNKSTIEGVNLVNSKSEKISEDLKGVISTNEWGLKVKMYAWLVPTKNINKELKEGELTQTQNNEE